MKWLLLFSLLLSIHCQGEGIIAGKIIQAIEQKNEQLLFPLFSKSLLQELNPAAVILLLKNKEVLYGAIEKVRLHKQIADKLYFIIRFKGGLVPVIIGEKQQKITSFDIGFFLPKSLGEIEVQADDGLKLHTKLGTPVGTKIPQGIVIMIPDFGLNDYNGNSQEEITRRDQDGIFYRFSREFRLRKFFTVRYNSRQAELNFLETIGEPIVTYKAKQGFKVYNSLLSDVKAQIRMVKKRFVGIPVYLLGVGLGANIAIDVANSDMTLKGVVAIGFSAFPALLNSFWQFIAAPRALFANLDMDKDGRLTGQEISTDVKQMDINGDGIISLTEFDTFNLLTFAQSAYKDDDLKKITIAQLVRQNSIELLKKSWYKVVFMHGEYDIFAPFAGIRAFQLASRGWKKDNFKFMLLPQTGHLLNRKQSLLDANFKPMPITYYGDWVSKIISFF